MADMDASFFVIDCLPNVTIEQMNEKYVRFLEIIRKKKAGCSDSARREYLFPHMYFDRTVFSLLNKQNSTLQQIYSGQKAKGDRNLYYMKADKLIWNDSEATVDAEYT